MLETLELLCLNAVISWRSLWLLGHGFQNVGLFAHFEEDKTGNGIDDQNNDNIDEPQDILEEHVDDDKKDDDDNKNEVIIKSQTFGFSEKSQNILFFLKAKNLTSSIDIGPFLLQKLYCAYLY